MQLNNSRSNTYVPARKKNLDDGKCIDTDFRDANRLKIESVRTNKIFAHIASVAKLLTNFPLSVYQDAYKE